MTWHRPPPPRGVTLLELLVALAVSTIVVAAASMLLIAQQRAHVSGSGQRATQEGARVALDEIGRHLRGAGYGIDPALTLDFGEQDDIPRSKLYTAGRGYVRGYLCDTPVTCRDRIDGSDEIVFHYRDPLFSRPVSAVGNTTLTLVGDLREPLYAGQILQVLCLGDTRTVAYVTVGRFLPAPAVPNPTANVAIQLESGQSGGALALPEFGHENGEFAAPCFSAGPTAVMVTKIDRYRYYVDTFDDAGGGRVNPGTPGSRPYLMLDQGLRDQAGQPIRSPVAPDVEDLQFAYLYRPLVAGGGSRLIGAATDGTDLAGEGVTVAVAPPGIGDAPDAPSRRTLNPANILGVRAAVVVRTPEHDADRYGPFDRTLPRAGNRPDSPNQLPGYRRTMFETTILLKNNASRDLVYPVVDPTRAIVGSLVGGG